MSAAGNWVFRVTHAQQVLALRISAPGTRTKELIAAELAYAEELRLKHGIRTPEPIPGRDGHPIQIITGPDGESRLVVLFTWLAGRPLGYRPTADQMEILGRCQARMHAFAISDRPSCAKDRRVLDADEVIQWTRMPAKAEALLEEGDRALVERVAALLRERVPTLFERSPQALVHFDLTGGNVLLEGSEVGLIDFDDCLNAPIILDLATALTYTSAKPDADALRAAFLKGHGTVHGLASELADLLDTAIGLIALREIRRVLDRPLVTADPSGPVVLQESLQVIRATALRLGVHVGL